MTATSAASRPDPVVEEAVEATLEMLGWAWSKREMSWAVPANPTLPRELRLSATERGVRVEAVLIDAEEATPEVLEALTRFLLQAQGGIRCARCELDGHVARIASVVAAEHIDADLMAALQGVAVAVRLLGREAAALLNSEAARAYLAFHGEKETASRST